jgi:hypothetical protein
MSVRHLIDILFGQSLEWLFVRVFVYISLGAVLWSLRPVPASQRALGVTGHAVARNSRRGLWAGTAFAAAALVCVGAFGWEMSPTHHAAQSVALADPVHINLAPPYIGVFEPGEEGSYQSVNKFGSETGRQPQIVLSYSPWNQSFNSQFADTVRNANGIPFIEVLPKGVSMSSIADGSWDSYIRLFAKQIRQFGSRVVIGFAPEMNGNWYSWGNGNTPSSTYIAAWRHVVDVFRETGASNATWLWVVNDVVAGETPISHWWPGANYVTWIGIDGYYYQPTADFDSVFGLAISEVRSLTNKPILISETAVGPGPQAATQIEGIFKGVKSNHLIGMVWFDESQSGGQYALNWRIEGDPARINAFRDGVESLPPNSG